MPVRALSFDLFDTLVDLAMDALPEFELDGQVHRGTHPQLHRVLRDHTEIPLSELVTTLAAVDRDLRETWASEGRELPTRTRFAALGQRLGISDPSLAEKLTRAHMGKLRELARTPPHHAALLAELASSFELALCSNFSDAATARLILDEAHMAKLFSTMAISEEIGYRKPRPEIFRAVCDSLALEPAEILHVGDRLDADVAGAARAGLRTVWLTRRVSDPDARLAAYTGPAPDHVIRDLASLPELLSHAR